MSAVTRRSMNARKYLQVVDKIASVIPQDGPDNVQQQHTWLVKMREALAAAKKEIGPADPADAEVAAQQKVIERTEKVVKDAEARWSTINDKKDGPPPAGGAPAPNSNGGGNMTDKDADADAEAETEAEEDELHDEDDHAGATAPAARAQAAENGHAAPEDAKHTNNSKTEQKSAQRKPGRVQPGNAVKRIVHDPKCERCTASNKTCIGIEGRACQPCGLMKMKCSMSSKVGRQPITNATADANSTATPSAGTKSRAAAQRANGHDVPNNGNGTASVSAGGKRQRDDDDSLSNILSGTDPASASAAGVLTSLRSSSKRPRNNSANNINANAHTNAAEALKELKASISKDIKEASKGAASSSGGSGGNKGKARAASLDDSAILKLVTPLLQMQAAMADMSAELVKLIEKNKG